MSPKHTFNDLARQKLEKKPGNRAELEKLGNLEEEKLDFQGETLQYPIISNYLTKVNRNQANVSRSDGFRDFSLSFKPRGRSFQAIPEKSAGVSKTFAQEVEELARFKEEIGNFSRFPRKTRKK